MKKTKIICTVGPSTDNVELLRKMMLMRHGLGTLQLFAW